MGGGFFDDRDQFTRTVGNNPGQIFSVGTGIITLNSGSNDLTFIPNFFQPQRLDFGSGGVRPVAAVMGDFSGDGRSDLLVANNGNGIVSLLLGDASGFILSRTFSHADVRHPSALAVSVARGGVEIYVTDEGRESAILLTSFGIPVPATGAARLPLPTDIVVVSGPGFLFPVNIFTTGEADRLDVAQIQTVPLEQFAALAFASLLFGDGEGEFFASGDDGPQAEDAADADPEAAAASAMIGFMIGVDDALRDTLATASVEVQYRAAVDAVMSAIDHVFSEWLPSLVDNVRSIDAGQWLALAPLTGIGNELLMSFLFPPGATPQIVDSLYEFVEELFSGNPTDRDQVAPEVAPHDLLPAEASSANQPLLDAATCDVGWLDHLWIALLYASYRLHVPSPSWIEENRTRRALLPRSMRR